MLEYGHIFVRMYVYVCTGIVFGAALLAFARQSVRDGLVPWDFHAIGWELKENGENWRKTEGTVRRIGGELNEGIEQKWMETGRTGDNCGG